MYNYVNNFRPVFLGAPLKLIGALSAPLVRLWVNPALRVCSSSKISVTCRAISQANGQTLMSLYRKFICEYVNFDNRSVSVMDCSAYTGEALHRYERQKVEQTELFTLAYPTQHTQLGITTALPIHFQSARVSSAIQIVFTQAYLLTYLLTYNDKDDYSGARRYYKPMSRIAYILCYYRATLCIARSCDRNSVRSSVRLSVYLSVCPSVTLVDCVHMVRPTIMISSPYGSLIILVSGDITIVPKFEGGHPERGR